MATEDGSVGFKGLVTHLLEQFTHPAPRTPTRAQQAAPLPRTPHCYLCLRPSPDAGALAPIAEKYDLPYQASLEANMACGFGACVGCVVPVKGGEGHRTYRLVCKDGPVFDAHDILWA
jgi:dihydroorotate dehydrogenase electron transfer subunit